MEELKEQAHKEFDEKFTLEGNRWRFFDRNSPAPVKDFIDSLIDKTVQMTEERIVGEIKTKLPLICGVCDKGGSNPYGECKCSYQINKYYKAKDVISLITNKSGINK